MWAPVNNSYNIPLLYEKYTKKILSQLPVDHQNKRYISLDSFLIVSIKVKVCAQYKLYPHAGEMFLIMEPGVYISDFSIEGLISAIDPDALKVISSSWRETIERYAPWHRSDSAGQGMSPRPVFWRSDRFSRDETFFICGACPSTMDVARWFADNGLLSPWSSILSIVQTGGRGQRGRQWISPSGNLYGSWRWPVGAGDPERQKTWRNLASLLAGGIAASVIEDMGVPVQLKWPNDLIVHDRKLGGILVEDRNGVLVVGFGINVASAPADSLLRNDFVLPAVCLDSLGIRIPPLDLWIRLVTGGRRFFDRMTQHAGPAAFIEWLQTKMAWIGKNVRIQPPTGEIYSARIEGLARDGGLCISRNHKSAVIYNGSILFE